jgi:hypothetical protein
MSARSVRGVHWLRPAKSDGLPFGPEAACCTGVVRAKTVPMLAEMPPCVISMLGPRGTAILLFGLRPGVVAGLSTRP